MSPLSYQTGPESGLTSGTSDGTIVPDHNGTNWSRKASKSRKFDGRKESLQLDNIVRNAVTIADSVAVSELSLAPVFFRPTEAVLVAAGQTGRTAGWPGQADCSEGGGRTASSAFSGPQQAEAAAAAQEEGEQGEPHDQSGLSTVSGLSQQ